MMPVPSISRNNPDSPSLWRTIGLMSGTSLDGVDAALIETDGVNHIKPLGFVTLPYPDSFRTRARALFGWRADPSGQVAEVARDLTHHHLAAILSLLVQTGYQANEIDLIGFHGQTITHIPQEKFTWQVGDPDYLAKSLGCPVVFDFRVADVAAGGQGAPLIPIYHQALVARAGLPTPIAILNIGGIANITYIGEKDADLLAFDTGMGNGLIDDMVLNRTGKPYDYNGELAAAGTIDQKLLSRWLDHPYFSKHPPKSLDRALDFNAKDLHNHSTADAVATLTAFTVQGVARALSFLPQKPTRLLVAGGGRHNRAIMSGLQAALGIPVEPVDAYGLNGDAVEAEGFAYMAVRRLRDLPISFPGTTGVSNALVGGRVYEPGVV
jgi:anhydro-N-acetylmuramic acid kinase